jgi:hypothetical protein
MSASDTPETNSNSKGFAHRLFSYETFGISATVVGFVVDSIAIASLLLAIRLDSPIILTPYHALFIWCIAVFTYFCMLQIYWRRKQPNLQGAFGGFLLFYVPGNQLLLLLPLLVLILFLIWILAELIPTLDTGAQAILLFLALLGGIIGFIALVGLTASGTLAEAMRNAKLRFVVANNPQYWNKLIATRLKGQQWIGTSALLDIYKQYEPSVETLETLLAQYASAHPETAFFGMVFYRNKNEYVYKYPVLVNLKLVDRTKYTF